MQIHVVSKGQSVFNIATTYGTTVQAIVDANELETPNQLVVGQALVIPIMGHFYYVQPGDTLYAIARMFGLSTQELARVNNISIDRPLDVGFRLYIPAPQQKPPITSIGYIQPTGSTVSQSLINAATNNTQYLTYLAPFNYHANRDGSLTPPPLDNLREIARNNNAQLMLVVTNLERGNFSSELGHILLTVQHVQNNLLDNIVNTAVTEGYKDVHFDFEYLPPEDREAYNSFLRKAKERFSQAGLTLSTAVAPKTSAEQAGTLYTAHDYAVHGEIADFVILMTYEWGYSAGPAQAVSPLDQVRKVAEYALTEIPAEKIVLGQNLYGYDWTLPFVEGGEYARAISPQQAITIARKNNTAIQFDQTAQAPFFTYYDSSGSEHEVWFEDARSIQAKFDLIKELDLRGIAYWKLGLSFPQNWLLLENNFTVTKL
ncbi:glycoside hydrolase family 18 protein [Virgibacillus sp. MSJ-26]|uniref:LysM peptidoglycan-binding domain-containing protein n=1 Tax=Virgibacillus sp. MSJ-26 TaxID=2841522 RepID=UPI001C11AB4E|nr:glycoside hydrolase family 18 protein [Virgibacillus sp. MSJ-26]